MQSSLPIHDRRRLRFRSPREFKETLLQHYPLTNQFIDWVVEQGFQIVYIKKLGRRHRICMG